LSRDKQMSTSNGQNGNSQTNKSQASNWQTSPRWRSIARPYTQHDVNRLRGSFQIEHTLARHGAERLWNLLHDEAESYVPALGAMTGNQAVQQVKAGLKAIYVSGWQVAADANNAGQMYPDQSLYPADSVPNLVRRINQALMRADQIHHAEGNNDPDINWFPPLIADAEAGFGGNLNAFELMKAMIEAGAACVHFEDQLSSAKKCGHLGGKVLVPTTEAIQKLVAARLAADVMGVPTLIMARTDADSANLLTSDIDPRDREFLTGERTVEGFYHIRGGLRAAIARAIAYAPYADILWCETSKPDLKEAREFAEAVHHVYPGKLLAYNCSPSFNWKKNLDDATIASFQRELAAMGYKFQFITLAGFHTLNFAMFELARGYKQAGMTAYSRLQEKEFLREREVGYEAVKHQRFVGTGYFDAVQQVITNGTASTVALEGSTEEAQFTGGVDPRMEDRSMEDLSMKSLTADPVMADPSLIAARWEASDELMPSGD
jgi:isocitrate lyase